MDSSKIFVKAQMLIRKPIDEVFEAFVNPEITSNFWFTKSSGRLEEGKEVTWEWEIYNAKTEVSVIKILPNQLIATKWKLFSTHVDYEFSEKTNGTLVVIKSYGYSETGNELLEVINDNVGGFTTVLDGCKAWLEHGIHLNLVIDKFPSD